MADIDHRFMAPPFLRIMEQRQSSHGGETYLWDLRIAQPNVTSIPMSTIHSIEHLLATQLRAASDAVVAVAPMGCQTGFYIVTVDLGDWDKMAMLIIGALQAVLAATEVPLANNVQCGWAQNHNLTGAQEVAAWLLHHSSEWQDPGTAPVDAGV